MGGPLWSPAGWGVVLVPQDGRQGTRTRATIKALPAAHHPPSLYKGRFLAGLALLVAFAACAMLSLPALALGLTLLVMLGLATPMGEAGQVLWPGCRRKVPDWQGFMLDHRAQQAQSVQGELAQ